MIIPLVFGHVRDQEMLQAYSAEAARSLLKLEKGKERMMRRGEREFYLD